LRLSKQIVLGIILALFFEGIVYINVVNDDEKNNQPKDITSNSEMSGVNDFSFEEEAKQAEVTLPD
jgi:hypothetical protein